MQSAVVIILNSDSAAIKLLITIEEKIIFFQYLLKTKNNKLKLPKKVNLLQNKILISKIYKIFYIFSQLNNNNNYLFFQVLSI